MKILQYIFTKAIEINAGSSDMINLRGSSTKCKEY